jgi:hypothetical protein
MGRLNLALHPFVYRSSRRHEAAKRTSVKVEPERMGLALERSGGRGA